MSEQHTILNLLPHDHELRNKPLREIGAEACGKQATNWREVRCWAIGGNCFNELGSAWTDHMLFRVKPQ